jgi:trimethylamine:corrinoid methyltransferase-like protein
MIKLGFRISVDVFQGDVWFTTVINSTLPGLLDNPMAQRIIDDARAGQMAIITPLFLAGAKAPLTVMGRARLAVCTGGDRNSDIALGCVDSQCHVNRTCRRVA